MGTAPLSRVNLVVDKANVAKLRKLLGTRSASEAVRVAVERHLASFMALDALHRLRDIGKLEDVLGRSARSRA